MQVVVVGMPLPEWFPGMEVGEEIGWGTYLRWGLRGIERLRKVVVVGIEEGERGGVAEEILRGICDEVEFLDTDEVEAWFDRSRTIGL